MATGFFDGVNAATFDHYNPDEVVLGKCMEDHLRFAVAYWHSFAWEGMMRTFAPNKAILLTT